jgi:hypothetical protein
VKIALIHKAHFPVQAYGGTERVMWWLAKGLSERGHQVTLLAEPGSRCDFASVATVDFGADIEAQVRGRFDVLHFFSTPARVPPQAHVITIGGNGKLGETFYRNTVFVSENHAQRHGAEAFVYNGIDPADYRFESRKKNYLIFLAKASWKVKNVKGAIRLAKQAGRPLHVLGGRSWRPRFLGRRVIWEGMIGGTRKADLLAEASGLLFPVIWHEPFGIAVIEALVSGTPVVASRLGSLPELIPAACGWVCDSEDEMQAALERLAEKRPEDCRDWAIENFHYHRMADRYLDYYEKVLAGNWLNEREPVAREPGEKIFNLPRTFRLPSANHS